MYTVSKAPSKLMAKTRRGFNQNYEKLEIKEIGKKSTTLNSEKKFNIPRPVFQTSKKLSAHAKHQNVKEIITPEHEEIIKYINESWNIIVAKNPYDKPTAITQATPDAASSFYCIESPSPLLRDFKPFDLESWWGRRLFNNITKNL